ncbi:hypothetical protein BJV78DRAFT_1349850 [Lactifluus subvellereus]|nr:hypothetical protein BJV78DRAFT_1349850 [Lactifluus subvellereus]
MSPRITYQALERAFDRLFKEQSLEETKQIVRRMMMISRPLRLFLQEPYCMQPWK